MKGTDSVTVSVEVTNTGSRRGAEVVQLYIRDDYASVTRPVKELKGFQKVWLEPGGRKTIQFVITRELLSFYNREMKWVAEPGDFSIMTGSASDKLQAVRMKLTR